MNMDRTENQVCFSLGQPSTVCQTHKVRNLNVTYDRRTESETADLKKYLESFLHRPNYRGSVPNKAACIAAQSKSSLLRQRKWPDLKHKVRNLNVTYDRRKLNS